MSLGTIGVVTATASGASAARTLAAAWPDEVRPYPAARLREAFEDCDAVVSFLAVGATVRVLAPHLGDKTTDAAVVCVDEARRFAVAVLGGHHGANELAVRVSALLGTEPVVTTASDAANVQPLDGYGAGLGFALADPAPLARIGARLLSGERVTVRGAEHWPLPPLPAVPAPDGEDADIEVSDRSDVCATLVYRPKSLVVGVGAARGVTAEEVLDAVDRALAEGGLSPLSVARLASVEAKADEVGILEAARRRGWPVVFHAAADLAAVEVPNPSEIVRAEVGTPSVAEAAARFDGPDRPLAELLVAKVKSAPVITGEAPRATAALARLAPRGRLALVGLGPGARDLLPPRAAAELRRASVVIGLDQYLDQVRDLLRPGTEVRATGLGSEEARAKDAVETARSGRAVALVGSGDSGLYAMASPALDLFAALDDADVVGVPGVTASLAASNILGAPLGHDHAVVSLSDLHTPWPVIERRIRAAAEGDFVTVFYNPRSKGRDWQLGRALEILAGHRPPTTPVGCVRNASRPDERSWIAELAAFDPAQVDMYTVVLVGSSQSRVAAGRMVTPRGYTWHEAL